MKQIREPLPAVSSGPAGLTAARGVGPDRAAARRAPARLYVAVRSLVRPVLRRLFDFRVGGLEHLPAHGPYLVAANHVNYLDGVVLAAALPRPIVFLVMPRVYRATPLHPYFHDSIGSIPISLDGPDHGAIRRALRALEAGEVVGIFPEGPFGKTGQLVRGHSGVALIALRAGVPVVPAAITGTFQALVGRRGYVPRRVPLAVRFGAPIRFGARGRLRRPQHAREDVAGRVMDEIAALLRVESRPTAGVSDAP